MDTDAFNLQDIKCETEDSFSCFDIFYSLILAADFVIYLSFVILNGIYFFKKR